MLANKLPSSSSKTTKVGVDRSQSRGSMSEVGLFGKVEDQFATHSRAHRLAFEKLPLIHPRKGRRSGHPIELKAAVALLRRDQSARLENEIDPLTNAFSSFRRTAESILENGGDPAMRLNAMRQ